MKRQNTQITTATWLLAGFCLAALPAIAGTSHLEVRWNEVANLIVGRVVAVPQPGGVIVRGEVMGVRDEGLTLNVTNGLPRGRTLIPRASVSEIRLTETSGATGRILGTVAGTLGGIVAGIFAAVEMNSNAAGGAVFTSVAAGSTTVGYLLGRAADRRTRIIRIVQ